METKYYNLIDTQCDVMLLKRVISRDVRNYFNGVFTNVFKQAETGRLYKKRYRVEFAKKKIETNENIENYKESRSTKMHQGTLTIPIIYARCKDYRVGDKVYIKESEFDAIKGSMVVISTPATITERYQHHLVIKRKGGVEESFLYRDILFGAIEKRKKGA